MFQQMRKIWSFGVGAAYAAVPQEKNDRAAAGAAQSGDPLVILARPEGSRILTGGNRAGGLGQVVQQKLDKLVRDKGANSANSRPARRHPDQGPDVVAMAAVAAAAAASAVGANPMNNERQPPADAVAPSRSLRVRTSSRSPLRNSWTPEDLEEAGGEEEPLQGGA